MEDGIDGDTRTKGAMLTLERALDLLEAFTSESPQLGLGELSRVLKVPKSSVFRYLAVLERRGYLQRGPDGRYGLGVKLLGMGNLVRSQLRIADIASPIMHELRSHHGETVNVGILERGEIIHIEVVEGLFGIKMTSPVGSRAPAHSTGLGKAILAFSEASILDDVIEYRGLQSLTDRTLTSKASLLKDLELVRERGYAVDNGESEQGLCCVGAPIFASTGQVVAAMSISGPRLRMQPKMGDLAHDVMGAAAQVSHKLGFIGPGSSQVAS